MNDFLNQLSESERRAVNAYIEGIKSTWARITDDSMFPTLALGDVVRALPAQEGDVVIAEIDGELFVRRLSGDKLTPDNKDYKEISADSAKILGRVVQIIRHV